MRLALSGLLIALPIFRAAVTARIAIVAPFRWHTCECETAPRREAWLESLGAA